jgi:hypothetical protein
MAVHNEQLATPTIKIRKVHFHVRISYHAAATIKPRYGNQLLLSIVLNVGYHNIVYAGPAGVCRC